MALILHFQQVETKLSEILKSNEKQQQRKEQTAVGRQKSISEGH